MLTVIMCNITICRKHIWPMLNNYIWTLWVGLLYSSSAGAFKIVHTAHTLNYYVAFWHTPVKEEARQCNVPSNLKLLFSIWTDKIEQAIQILSLKILNLHVDNSLPSSLHVYEIGAKL